VKVSLKVKGNTAYIIRISLKLFPLRIGDKQNYQKEYVKND